MVSGSCLCEPSLVPAFIVALSKRGGSRSYLEADSSLRWNWQDGHAYEISDQQSYASRLDHFRRFQKCFYEGIEPNPLVHGDEDLFFFEYPALGIVIVGPASWHGNDCFCHVGEIKPTSLALSQKLVAKSRMDVAVGVWHHSITGGPRAHDYMDQRTVHRMVDFGILRPGLVHRHVPLRA